MRIRLFLLIIFSLTLFAIHGSHASDEYYEEEFQNVPNLSRGEVQQVLVRIGRSDAKIVSVRESIVYGLYEVIIDHKGQYEMFYLDISKIYLIPGPVIELHSGINKSVEKLTEFERKRRVDLARIPLGDALILGDKKAATKVIVFTDPDCPFCAKLHAELKKVVDKRTEIAFYIKLFPLQINSDAYWKSKTILCDSSLKLLEENFAKRPIPKPEPDCQAKEVDENIKLAKELGIRGTPTLIMPDGSIHPGFLEADPLIERVDSHNTKKR